MRKSKPEVNDHGIDRYAQFGLAALIPGMQHMITLMQAALDAMRLQLAAAQNGAEPERRKYTRAEGARNAWEGMSAAERSAEMVRRKAVARARKADEQAHNRKSESAKRRWANLPKAQRAARVAAMTKARLAKQPKVKLAVAS